jgi:transposase
MVAEGTFSINRICKLVGISKNTYYHHKHSETRFEEKYQYLKNKVEKIIRADNSYGIKRIKSALKEQYNIEVGRDALGRLLKIWGLELRRKLKKPKISLLKKY